MVADKSAPNVRSVVKFDDLLHRSEVNYSRLRDTAFNGLTATLGWRRKGCQISWKVGCEEGVFEDFGDSDTLDRVYSEHEVD